MRYSYDLNYIQRLFTIDHKKGKPVQQVSARVEWAGCPSKRSLLNLRECPFDLGVEFAGCVGTAIQIPVKGCVVFNRCLLMKLDLLNAHEGASRGCGL
jgi:hypothetical protein